jgi:hypothetical protein
VEGSLDIPVDSMTDEDTAGVLDRLRSLGYVE